MDNGEPQRIEQRSIIMIKTTQLKNNELKERLKKLSKPINEVVSMVSPTAFHNRMKPIASTLKSVDNSVEDDDEDLLELQSEKKAWLWIMVMMLIMGGASHLLVESSLALGDMLGIDGVIMGFVVIAAGTSVPDTALSVISAKKGHYDAAVSNVFGSNIFDICVCLSIPILIALTMSGEPTFINLPQTGLIWSLIGATLLAIYFFWSNNYTLTKVKAGMMGILYLLIILISFTF